MTARKIVRTPGVCGGRPLFKGTRIWPEIVCRNVPTMGRAWVLDGYPALTDADIDAALVWCSRPHRRLGWWVGRRLRNLLNVAYDRYGDD